MRVTSKYTTLDTDVNIITIYRNQVFNKTNVLKTFREENVPTYGLQEI